MSTAVLFVHGRSQASDDEIARDPERLAAYVLGKKRKWLAGLSKGLIAAGHSGALMKHLVRNRARSTSSLGSRPGSGVPCS